MGAAFAAGFTGTVVGAGASGLAVTIAGSAFAGAVIGGTTEDILNSASSSFMFGTALGAFSEIVNPISMAANEVVNIGIHMGINSLATVGTYLGQTAYMDGNLNNVSFGGLLITAIGGAAGGFLPNSVASSGYYNYISI